MARVETAVEVRSERGIGLQQEGLPDRSGLLPSLERKTSGRNQAGMHRIGMDWIGISIGFILQLAHQLCLSWYPKYLAAPQGTNHWGPTRVAVIIETHHPTKEL